MEPGQDCMVEHRQEAREDTWSCFAFLSHVPCSIWSLLVLEKSKAHRAVSHGPKRLLPYDSLRALSSLDFRHPSMSLKFFPVLLANSCIVLRLVLKEIPFLSLGSSRNRHVSRLLSNYEHCGDIHGSHHSLQCLFPHPSCSQLYQNLLPVGNPGILIRRLLLRCCFVFFR